MNEHICDMVSATCACGKLWPWVQRFTTRNGVALDLYADDATKARYLALYGEPASVPFEEVPR
jgi:hypothetical protein